MATDSLDDAFREAVAHGLNAHLAGRIVLNPPKSPSLVHAESELWRIEMHLGRFRRCVHLGLHLLSEAVEAEESMKRRIAQLREAAARGERAGEWRQATRETLAEPGAASTWPVELWDVLGFLCPDLPEAERCPRQFRSVAEMAAHAYRQLGLLAQHFGPLLEGDIAQWERLREAERYGFGTQQSDGEAWDDYLTRLRNAASEALRRAEYWTANRYYCRYAIVGGRMTPGDRLRHWRASRHTFFLD
jgi:hypothetical protein